MGVVDPLVAHLVEARKKAGLSQAKVAGAVGFSCATSGRLSEYETGRRQPSLATLRRWAQVLGFEPAWVELAYEPKIFYSHEEFDAYLSSIPSTAPAVPEIAAGNGATPQDGRELSSVAPASDPAPVDTVAGSDVAPGDSSCGCDLHLLLREELKDPDFAAAWERALKRDAVTRTVDVAERTVEKAREARADA